MFAILNVMVIIDNYLSYNSENIILLCYLFIILGITITKGGCYYEKNTGAN
jgi:hypothetical protein